MQYDGEMHRADGQYKDLFIYFIQRKTINTSTCISFQNIIWSLKLEKQFQQKKYVEMDTSTTSTSVLWPLNLLRMS